jgi:hypothetical protein
VGVGEKGSWGPRALYGLFNAFSDNFLSSCPTFIQKRLNKKKTRLIDVRLQFEAEEKGN